MRRRRRRLGRRHRKRGGGSGTSRHGHPPVAISRQASVGSLRLSLPGLATVPSERRTSVSLSLTHSLSLTFISLFLSRSLAPLEHAARPSFNRGACASSAASGHSSRSLLLLSMSLLSTEAHASSAASGQLCPHARLNSPIQEQKRPTSTDS